MTETASQPRAPRRKGGVVIPHQPTAKQRLAGLLVVSMIRLIAVTIRYRLHGDASEIPKPVIFCIWHNRLALCLPIYRRYLQRAQPDRRLAAMVSASRDGGFLSHILGLFRVQPVRGSTSRRGPQALRELLQWGRKGYDLAITPDGPQGPRYIVQDGVSALAQVSGIPILPVSYSLKWKVAAPSWDGFQIPLPFSRCDVQVGPLQTFPRHLEPEERQAKHRQLQEIMVSITRD